MDERTLAFLEELERADEETGAMLAELDELAAEVDRIRARVLELQAFFTAESTERESLLAALSDAERDEAERRAQLDPIQAADDPAAERALVRARDALRMAERRLQVARADAERFEAEATAAAREAADLEKGARDLAQALRDRPGLAAAGSQLSRGLDGLLAWATAARAALFVARGNLTKEREGLIRQANELGALVLGPSFSAESPAVVARRIRETG